MQLRKYLKNSFDSNCAYHAQLFFNSNDLDLKNAVPGTLSLTPTKEMISELKNDYHAMSGMIFGAIPKFSDVIQAISDLERNLNESCNAMDMPISNGEKDYA